MNVIARIKIKGKNFEVLVEFDKAIVLKKQKPQGNVQALLRDVLEIDEVFLDHKKGLKASHKELIDCFGTDNVYDIALRIIMQGEIQEPQEYREKAREQKLKQIVDYITRNCIDPRTGAPYTASRVENSLKQIGARIDDRNVTEQVALLIKELAKIMPIKIASKKITIKILPEYISRVYSFLKYFKKNEEEYLSDGTLVCVIEIPAGMQLEFYDKLNNLTHGTAITQEIKQEE